MVLESEARSPAIQTLRKYPIFCCLPVFTYLKSIAVSFYHCQPAVSMIQVGVVVINRASHLYDPGSSPHVGWDLSISI